MCSRCDISPSSVDGSAFVSFAMGNADRWMLRATLFMFLLLLAAIMIGHVPS